MRIKDIAQALGFSTTTVSVCLAGREDDPRYKIQKEKAERIREFALRKGYVPNVTARKLRTPDSSSAIGLLFRINGGMARQFHEMNRVMTKLSARGMSYYVIGYEDQFLAPALTILLGMQVKHAIVFPPFVEPCEKNHAIWVQRIDEESNRRVDALYEDRARIATMLQNMTLYSVNYLFPRPVNGGITRGIIRMGTNIGRFMRTWIKKINGAGLGPVVVASWCGEEPEMLKEGLLQCPEHIFYPQFIGNRFEEGKLLGKHLREVWKRHPFRTVFAGNDSMAAGILADFLDHGIRVPEQIGILGFGNDDGCECYRLPLSTFDSNVGRNAETVINAIAGKSPIPDEKEEDFIYIERASFRMPTG